MEKLASIAFYLGLIAYSAAATLYFVDFSRRGEARGARLAWAPRALGIAALGHGTHVVSASLLSNVCPVASSHFALSLAALVAVIVFLIANQPTRLRALGVFVAPLALTFLVGAQFVRVEHRPLDISPALLALHVTANLLGVGLFLLAGGAAGFYLIQERRLRLKRGGRSNLPALEVLDRNEHRLLLAGFPLLTFGVVSGAVFTSELGGASGATLLRALLGYASWVLVAAVLGLRATAGWRGRRSAYGTILGALFVLAVMVLYAIRPVAEVAS